MPSVPPSPGLRGVGVVIDDRVFQEKKEADLIGDLLKQITDTGVPCLLYKDLPPDDELPHLHNVSFILLDWELWRKPGDEDAMSGARVASALEGQGIKNNIKFLKELREICFAPVFIFSNAAPGGIENTLRDAGLIADPPAPNHIFVQRKADLARDKKHPGGRLLQAITQWTEQTPSVYLLSRWRESMLQSQNSLFWDLYKGDPLWPAILWKAYDEENVPPEPGLADVLHRNIRARMHPLQLDGTKIAPASAGVASQKSIRKILETAMIVPEDRLPEGQYAAGDIFKGSRQRYYVNIRCDCDCIARGENAGEPQLYFLSAKPVSPDELEGSFDKKNGLIQKNNTCNVVFPVAGKGLRVNFRDLKLATASAIQKEGFIRFGRITAPHITEIRQRYALYLQREGLPRIPNEAVYDPASNVEDRNPEQTQREADSTSKIEPARKNAVAKPKPLAKKEVTKKAAPVMAKRKSPTKPMPKAKAVKNAGKKRATKPESK